MLLRNLVETSALRFRFDRLCCDERSLELSQVLLSPVNFRVSAVFAFVFDPVQLSLLKSTTWRFQQSLELYTRFCALAIRGPFFSALSCDPLGGGTQC
jgi:hypothetical protein